MITQIIEVPDIGSITAAWTARGLHDLFFPGEAVQAETRPTGEIGHNYHWLSSLERLLRTYFNGLAVNFSGIPVDFRGYTAFQSKVLIFVRGLPYGTAVTYGAVAEKINQPGAARAVGQALRQNRTPIVIPCHRVLGRRSLGGFASGLPWKKRLLRLEGFLPGQDLTTAAKTKD